MAGASVNKVILLGNLGRDPEVRYTGSGKAVATFTMATTDRGGREGDERTEWHRVVVWDRLAEQCGQFLTKGRQVFIEGRLQTRDWTDRSGNQRQTTEIVASSVQFLGGGRGGGGSSGGQGGPPPPDDTDYNTSHNSGSRQGYGDRGGQGGGGGGPGGGGSGGSGGSGSGGSSYGGGSGAPPPRDEPRGGPAEADIPYKDDEEDIPF